MSRSSALADLLFHIRQHPAFNELLEQVPRPRVRPIEPSASLTLEQVGVQTSFDSGRRKQDNAWRTVLTGEDFATKE